MRHAASVHQVPPLRQSRRIAIVLLKSWSVGKAVIRPAPALAIVASMTLAAPQDSPAPARELVGGIVERPIRRGDSLTSLSARFGVDVQTLARDNGLAATARLVEGRTLTIDHRHIVPAALGTGIVINIPQRMLFFRQDAEPARAYPVGLGRPDWRTPTGAFDVIVAEVDPTWDVPRSIQEEMRRQGRTPIVTMPPCPENPLGQFWLGLSLPGIGIHGTNSPSSIYRFSTHGCVRLHPDDVRELFGLVGVGTSGRILYEPTLVAEVGGRVFVEAHRDVYGKGGSPMAIVREAAADAGLTEAIDWDRTAGVVRAREGVARDVTADRGR